MEQYKLLLKSNGESNEYALRISDNAFIHRELNTAYLKWLSEGNEPLPADQPPEPEVVPSPEPEVVPSPEPEVVPTPEQETPAP